MAPQCYTVASFICTATQLDCLADCNAVSGSLVSLKLDNMNLNCTLPATALQSFTDLRALSLTGNPNLTVRNHSLGSRAL